jgi:glycosyltransferase involved in cell wall biosynthesis
MRIVIDMQGLQTQFSKSRGVGRYTEMIVKEFIAIAMGKHEIYLVLNGCFVEEAVNLIDQFSSFLPRENIKCWQQYLSPVSGISNNYLEKNISEIIREYFIESLNPDLIWSTNLQEGWFDDAVTSVKRIKSRALHASTIYDVIPLLYPKTHLASKIKNWYFEKIEYARRSDILLTVSEFSRLKIIDLLDVDQSKVHVAYCAVSDDFYPVKEDLYPFWEPYVLYVGGGDEHKNLDILILAYSFLPIEIKSKFKLRFVGVGLSQIVGGKAKILGVDSINFVFNECVDNEELVSIYSRASLFVCPSLSEGFGIPPLEAMACGVPVISSSAASLPEVVGNELALFDPTNVNELRSLMHKALTDESFRADLISTGLLQASNFSWRQSAEKILKIFEEYSSLRPAVYLENKSSYFRLIEDLLKIDNFEKANLFCVAKSISESALAAAPKGQKKRIYVDLSSFVHFDDATGIQRVVRAITNELMKINSTIFDFHIVFSYPGHSDFYNAEIVGGRYVIPNEEKLTDHVAEFNANDVLIFLDLHPASAISKEITIPRLRSIGVVLFFVIYDILPVELPDYFLPELSAEFKDWLRIVSLSDGALCISRDVRDKYERWTVENGIRLSDSFNLNYFHLGADISNSMPSRGVPENAVLFFEKIKNKPTFLMVGTVEPRKGHKLALDAFEEMWSNGSENILVIVGKPGWRNDATINRIRSSQYKESKLFWWDNASDEFLDLIYKRSTCLVAASEGEGFGLPLIEAAHRKIPIIARDIPVFREVAGTHAFYFDGEEPRCLVSAIDTWLNHYKESTHPHSEDMPWLTWKQSAQQLLIAANVILI